MLLGLRLHLQFVLLLLELLDDGVVEIQRQSVERAGLRVGEIGLIVDILAQGADEKKADEKGDACAEEYGNRTEQNWIGQ
jgi:hypothetical protein